MRESRSKTAIPESMKGQLRVLQILTNLDRGGMETLTMDFYRHMDRSRVQFDFLLHRDSEGDYETEARSLGARVYRVPRQNPLSPVYWCALERFFSRHPYRVVHAQLDCMSALPLSVAARHGAVVRVAHSHNSGQDRDYKYPLKLLCKRNISGVATHLFACGEAAGRWMFGTDDFRIVRNAIDVARFAFDPARRELARSALGIVPDALVVGHVGRFDPTKNQAFLVDVFFELLKEGRDAELVLVGEGRMRPSVQARTRELGIAGHVHFLGTRSDVPDLMQAMDVFCMPSRYEGLPLVLVEAQASGLPCVISDSIPPDCDLRDGAIVRVPLSSGAKHWASRLASVLGEGVGRRGGDEAVRAAGFDIMRESAWLQAFYLDAEAAS